MNAVIDNLHLTINYCYRKYLSGWTNWGIFVFVFIHIRKNIFKILILHFSFVRCLNFYWHFIFFTMTSISWMLKSKNRNYIFNTLCSLVLITFNVPRAKIKLNYILIRVFKYMQKFGNKNKWCHKCKYTIMHIVRDNDEKSDISDTNYASEARRS